MLKRGHRTNAPRTAQYVTTGAVAVACGVSTTAVKKWIHQGKLRALRTPGGHFRVPLSEIERLQDWRPDKENA